MGYRSVYKNEFNVNFDKHVKRLFKDLAAQYGLVFNGMDINICNALKVKFDQPENEKHRSLFLPTKMLHLDIGTLKKAFKGEASDQTYDTLTKWLYDREEVSFRLYCLDEEVKEMLPKTILEEVNYGSSLWKTDWKNYHQEIINKLAHKYPKRRLDLGVSPFEWSLSERLLTDSAVFNKGANFFHFRPDHFILYVNSRKTPLLIAALGSQVSGIASLTYVKAYLKLKTELNEDILIRDYYHSSALYQDLFRESKEFDFIVLPYHAYSTLPLEVKKKYLPLCATPSNDVPVYCSEAGKKPGLLSKLKEITVLTQDGSTHVSHFLERPLQQTYRTKIRLEHMPIPEALRKMKDEPDETQLVILFGRFRVVAEKIPGLREELTYQARKLEFFNFLFYNQERFTNAHALKDLMVLMQGVRLLFSQDGYARGKAVDLLLSDPLFREKTLAAMDDKCHELLRLQGSLY